MRITKGMCYLVKTKTAEDVFGDCAWIVEEVGLPAPESNRQGEMDGVRCRLLGGSGPSANPGRIQMDSEFNILRYINELKIASVIPEEKARAMGESWKGGERNPALGLEID